MIEIKKKLTLFTKVAKAAPQGATHVRDEDFGLLADLGRDQKSIT